MARELDEDDVRVRPSRSTRPRSKVRPDHAGAEVAVVAGVDRGRYACELPDGTRVVAVKARSLGRRSIVVGDEVRLTGDLGGAPGSLARLVAVEPRRTLLLRTADDVTSAERPLVANADQLAIVVAAADPAPRLGFVDRCLVAAYAAGIEPLLIVTKTDLADPADFLAGYAALEVRYLCINPQTGRSAVATALIDHSTVLVGQSGVGKSTLVNALVPAADRAIGHVNEVTGRGRHTSTSAVLLDLPGGGTIIDTPGVRTFGLNHVSPDTVVGAFGDLAGGLAGCPRGCSHDETDCALDEWVARGEAPLARLESLRRILRTRAEAPDY